MMLETWWKAMCFVFLCGTTAAVVSLLVLVIVDVYHGRRR